jgi:ABC-type multidrug transport system permease subunit
MARLDELRELTRVRILSFIREPEAIFWVFVFPVVLAAVLGFAFRRGSVEPGTLAVVQGEGSARLLEAIARDDQIRVEVFEGRDAAYEKLRKAAVDAMLEPGDPPKLTSDPSRPEAATALLRVRRALGLASGAADAPLEVVPITETGSRYVDFLFPGLIGMNLMGTGMWGIGFAIADMRRRRFLRRLMVTPMRRSSFFLSHMLSRLVFLTAEIAVLTLFGRFVLGVPFRGDVVSYALASLLGGFTFAGLGILIAARVRTIEGVSGLMNLVMMPMWLGSGVFFSYERFPDALHPALRLLPLTALNDALRAIMLDGDSILAQGPQTAVLAACGAVSFALALRIFRWE